MSPEAKKLRYNKHALPVAEIIGGVLNVRPLRMRLLHEDIFSQWHKIVGRALTDKCRPRRIKGHTLYLDVSSSSWAHQLIYLQEEIISRVNKLAGTLLIASIHCRAVKKRELKAGESENVTAAGDIDEELVSETEARQWQEEIATLVEDPELCDLLRRMRCHSEARKRSREKV